MQFVAYVNQTPAMLSAVSNGSVQIKVVMTWGENSRTYVYDSAVAARMYAENGTLNLKVSGIENATDLKLQVLIDSNDNVVEIYGSVIDARTGEVIS